MATMSRLALIAATGLVTYLIAMVTVRRAFLKGHSQTATDVVKHVNALIADLLSAVVSWLNDLRSTTSKMREKARTHTIGTGWWLPLRWVFVIVAFVFWLAAAALSFRVDAQSFTDLGWSLRAELAAVLFSIIKLIAGFFLLESAVPSLGVLPTLTIASRFALGIAGGLFCIVVVVAQLQLGQARAELTFRREIATTTSARDQAVLALKQSGADPETLDQQTGLVNSRFTIDADSINRRHRLNVIVEPLIGIGATAAEVLTAWSLFALIALLMLPVVVTLHWSTRPPIAFVLFISHVWTWLMTALLTIGGLAVLKRAQRRKTAASSVPAIAPQPIPAAESPVAGVEAARRFGRLSSIEQPTASTTIRPEHNLSVTAPTPAF
jgi:hypothetical protein